MQITVSKGDFWATISGSPEELRDVAARLRAVTVSLSPTGEGRALCLQTPAGLRVPAGAALILDAQQPPALEPAAHDRARTAAARLQEVGYLRDYQARAVLASLLAPLGRATVDVAMGGGKTRIAAALAAVAQLAAGEGNWLYLVQNGELARQAEREISDLLPKMAADLGGGPATVTATTYSGIKALASKTFDGVIVDECHLLPAPTRCLPFATVKATWRIGLSGTLLDRQDSKNALIIALLGPRVCEVKIPELERQGHLARGEVRVLRFDHARRLLVS